MRTVGNRWALGVAGVVIGALLPLGPQVAAGTADADLVPSGTWECAIGYYPYTSYQRLVTSGGSYTVSGTDGRGASSGTIAAGTHPPLNNGTPLTFQGGAWDGFKGEFAPAGTTTNPSSPPITVDKVYTDGGLDNNYYPATCSPE